MLGFLGFGTAALAGRSLAGCGSDKGTTPPADAGGFDSGNYRDGGNYNYPDGYNVPDTDAGETCAPTRPDAQGPFFALGAPSRTVIVDASEPGQSLSIFGNVVADDCVTPIEGALLDVWQADAAGVYHAAGTEYRLRGQMLTDSAGTYQFMTVKPGNYDGRPAHIHFTISKPGFVTVTTQLYFSGDRFLPPNDSCTGCGSDDPDRVIELIAGEGAVLLGEFKIILRRT